MEAIPRSGLREALKLHFRVLTFQATKVELESLDVTHLAMGLVWTWIVGVGRWWDDPGARPLQHLGLGSVIYVLVLSFVLWVVALALRPRNLSYLRVLTYVTLTAPPALLYALPVERWYGVVNASVINACFLGVVAVWRVAIYTWLMVRSRHLTLWRIAMAVLVPVMATIVVIYSLNLERLVLDAMMGQRPPHSAEWSYEWLFVLTLLSVYSSGPVLTVYGLTSLYAWPAPKYLGVGSSDPSARDQEGAPSAIYAVKEANAACEIPDEGEEMSAANSDEE